MKTTLKLMNFNRSNGNKWQGTIRRDQIIIYSRGVTDRSGLNNSKHRHAEKKSIIGISSEKFHTINKTYLY